MCRRVKEGELSPASEESVNAAMRGSPLRSRRSDAAPLPDQVHVSNGAACTPSGEARRCALAAVALVPVDCQLADDPSTRLRREAISYDT